MTDETISNYDTATVAKDESKVCPNKKETFRKLRDDLIDTYHCLKAIGEVKLGDELWAIIRQMFRHTSFGMIDNTDSHIIEVKIAAIDIDNIVTAVAQSLEKTGSDEGDK